MHKCGTYTHRMQNCGGGQSPVVELCELGNESPDSLKSENSLICRFTIALKRTFPFKVFVRPVTEVTHCEYYDLCDGRL
jgi:hypothetical protein